MYTNSNYRSGFGLTREFQPLYYLSFFECTLFIIFSFNCRTPDNKWYERFSVFVIIDLLFCTWYYNFVAERLAIPTPKIRTYHWTVMTNAVGTAKDCLLFYIFFSSSFSHTTTSPIIFDVIPSLDLQPLHFL